MSIEGRRSALEARHAEIDKRIEDMIAQPYYSDLEVADLKKQKLALKDELARIAEPAEA